MIVLWQVQVHICTSIMIALCHSTAYSIDWVLLICRRMIVSWWMLMMSQEKSIPERERFLPYMYMYLVTESCSCKFGFVNKNEGKRVMPILWEWHDLDLSFMRGRIDIKSWRQQMLQKVRTSGIQEIMLEIYISNKSRESFRNSRFVSFLW